MDSEFISAVGELNVITKGMMSIRNMRAFYLQDRPTNNVTHEMKPDIIKAIDTEYKEDEEIHDLCKQIKAAEFKCTSVIARKLVNRVIKKMGLKHDVYKYLKKLNFSEDIKDILEDTALYTTVVKKNPDVGLPYKDYIYYHHAFTKVLCDDIKL
ncbi:hypothetical protein BDK51DRAFT_26495 [Blyttiomyces helicus]|uniref:Uncharacterized protein n=1 Tax=Blyttiomyces helicus TaxID=388810 RepID=A0A4P9W4C2_9FUNG|nr:hypothetical protein BDK51DRAFT_26495 [Blyttiomyces helicus]|eukprot:RKO87199.1 hypothetical protein BDK51DRAFT_26495 [Blyttiomyces helicus]